MTARDRLDVLISGFRASQIIRAAAVHDVAGALAAGPLDAGEVADHTGCDLDGMRRLLRALAGLGIVHQNPDGTFANSELGDLLRADAEGSLRSAALGRAPNSWWAAWASLPETIRDGGVPFELANGRSFWDEVADDPVAAARFNEFMGARTSEFLPELTGRYDFSGAGRIVDIGGGNGALLGGILQSAPHAHGVLFDRPAGLRGAAEVLASLEVDDRCEVVAGSFFEAVPGGGEVYILRQVVHDWPDAAALQILRACREAMTGSARLLVIDRLLPERAAQSDRTAFEFDLQMLVLFGARERTEAELRSLIERAGLRVRSTIPTAPESTLVVTLD